MFVLLSGLLLFLTFFFVHADAKESRTVRVAFFPMEGFHTYSQKDGYGGVDADYLKELCRHTEWKVEYVQCSSWNDALEKLKKKEVDLVGSAQYSHGREEIYDYAALSSGYTLLIDTVSLIFLSRYILATFFVFSLTVLVEICMPFRSVVFIEIEVIFALFNRTENMNRNLIYYGKLHDDIPPIDS